MIWIMAHRSPFGLDCKDRTAMLRWRVVVWVLPTLVFVGIALVVLLQQSVLPFDSSSNFKLSPDIIGLEPPSSESSSSTRSLLLVQQSLCHEQSTFIQGNTSDAHVLATRLAFQAIAHHQSACRNTKAATKFLVVPIHAEQRGLGATVRLIVVPALIAGLVTNRIVVVQQWTLSHSIILLPLSSCPMPTMDDDNPAARMNRTTIRTLFRTGVLPAELEQERILVLPLLARPQRIPMQARQQLYRKARSLLFQEDNAALAITTWQSALDRLQQDDPTPETTNYYGSHSPLVQAIVLYSLRPTDNVRKQHLVSPQQHRVTPDRSIGLAIRATDKCEWESDCWSFQSHMDALREWNLSSSTMVVTTESSDVMQQVREYQTIHPSIQFLVDDEANLNSSSPSSFHPMIAALRSLQFQLTPRIVIGNCCSNFHLLMADLIQAGCGAGGGGFQCWQDHPTRKMCCAWDKPKGCTSGNESHHRGSS